MKRLINALIIATALVIVFHITKCACERFGGRPQVTLHYTNWCPHCASVKPIWKQVSLSTPGVSFNMVDEDIAHTPGITGYPTIVLTDSRGVRHKYAGAQDYKQLRQWVMSFQ